MKKTMKKFKEFLREDTPKISPTDEAKNRIAIEREFMLLPPTQNPNGAKEITDLSRHVDQVAYERSLKNPELDQEQNRDVDIRDSALSRQNAISNLEQTIDGYGVGPGYKIVTGALKDMYGKSIKGASKRLSSNPTYKGSSTVKIQTPNEE
jgi:hypothetical protein